MLAGLAAVLGLVSWWYVAAIGFGRYRARDLTIIALWSLSELSWYRPLTAIWRTWATLVVLFGRRPGWGTIPRGVAFRTDPQAEIVAVPLPR